MSKSASLHRLRDISKQRAIRRPFPAEAAAEKPVAQQVEEVEWPLSR